MAHFLISYHIIIIATCVYRHSNTMYAYLLQHSERCEEYCRKTLHVDGNTVDLQMGIYHDYFDPYHDNIDLDLLDFIQAAIVVYDITDEVCFLSDFISLLHHNAQGLYFFAGWVCLCCLYSIRKALIKFRSTWK